MHRPGQPPGPLRALLRARLAQRLGLPPQDDEPDAEAAPAAAWPPYAPPPGVAVQQDLPYGDDPAQRLDVYRAAVPPNGMTVLLVHGGGWRRGDKAQPALLRHKVAHWVGRGAAVVSANYRLAPQASPAEQADDLARALAFVQQQAPGWGGDPQGVVLVGHSAGAHLVALLSSDSGLAARHGAGRWRASVAIDTAAYDVDALMQGPHAALYAAVFGDDAAAWSAASPAARLAALREPPVVPLLLVCSSQRPVVASASRAFAQRVLALGGRAEVLALDLDHRELNEQLGSDAPYTAAVDDFLRRA